MIGFIEKHTNCNLYYFSIKWLIPFYPALIAQTASGGEKCMDYVF